MTIEKRSFAEYFKSELEDTAYNLIKPTLQTAGPIQFVDLVDKISDQLGFGEDEIKPLPIRAAVWNAWHQNVFSVASDRTVTLNKPASRHNPSK